MAEVDTGLYGNLLKQPSPIENASTFANMSNAFEQNKLLQTQVAGQTMTLEANRAMGPIMQQSVDPKTGQVDYSKAATLMAQNPKTAFLAPDFLMKAYQGQGLQLSNQIAKLDILGKQNKIFGDTALGAVAAYGDNVTTEDIAKQLTTMHSKMVGAGLDPDGKLADQIISFMGALPAPKGKPLADFIKGVGISHDASAQAIQHVTGSFVEKDAGPAIEIFHVNPFNQQYTLAGTIDKGPTPGEQNAPVQTQNPDGSFSVGTARQTLPMTTGLGAPVNPRAQAPGGPAVPAAPGVALGARPLTKISPEQQKWLENFRGTAAVDYAKNLQEEVGGVQTQLQMIQQLQDLSKQYHPGAGADIRTKLGGLMQAIGFPEEAYDKVANGSLSASQAFAKYSVQNTMNVLRQAIGGQGRLTNLEFEQFLHSNPNMDTDPRAIEKILSFSAKLYQIKIAEQKALTDWVSTGHAPADFPSAWTQKLVQRGILRAAKASDISQKPDFGHPEWRKPEAGK